MVYTVGLAFLTITFFYSLVLNILFFGRKHIETNETKIFGQMVVTNFIGIILEVLCILFLDFYGEDSLLSIVVNKLFLGYFLIIGYLFSNYVINTSYTLSEKKNEKVFNAIRLGVKIIFSISLLLLLFLKVNLYCNNGISYSYGPGPNLVFFMSGLCSVFCMAHLLSNFKNIKNKKNVPIIGFLIFMGIGAFVQQLFPHITLATSIETFIIFLMYHTIENPDVKMLEQMELAKDQAEKANRAKTDFLSSMSHEIRTPLNAIVGFSDCIMDAESLGEAKENAKDIVNASQTLLEIVNGILDISKIEAGKLEIVNSKYNAFETFEELAKLITPKMKEKGLDFTYSIAPDLPKTLFGDHANIKKIVTNLLSNACKYTERGFVHYEVNCVNSKGVTKLIISVEDSGRGIKKESIDKMFTKFQRLDEDRNTTIEGTGLGLAITKQLIELMGGRIIVHTVYGEGSKFTVVLNQKIETEDVVDKKKVSSTLDLHDVRIMMVDDTALNIKVGCKLLEKYHANHIVTCSNGFECLERIQRGEIYDLILLDDMMPKMSGVETLKKLKEIPGFKVPTIALTANAITGMREKYLADGFDDYLAKPIEKDQLIQVVNQVLGRSVTEEINVVEDRVIPDQVIRGEEIPNMDDVERAETSRENNTGIIPVEENVEETLGKTIERNYKQEIEQLETVNPVEELDLIPVVDINVNPSEEKVDRSYLESHGVDVNHALELLGDMDMYNMTISDFMKEVEEKWNKIVEYKNSNNMPDYAIEVHSLKSDCKYLGFMTLAEVAYQHELKSKENDSEFVNTHFAELEDNYKKVLEIAKEYVQHNPVEE